MQTLNKIRPHSHWFLRLALISVFLYHGTRKFPIIHSMAEQFGLPVWAGYLIASAEVLGAVLILYGGLTSGLITRAGAVVLIPVMFGAIAKVHWGQWSFAATESHPFGGMEFQVTLLLILVYFLFVGNDTGGKNVESPE